METSTKIWRYKTGVHIKTWTGFAGFLSWTHSLSISASRDLSIKQTLGLATLWWSKWIVCTTIALTSVLSFIVHYSLFSEAHFSLNGPKSGETLNKTAKTFWLFWQTITRLTYVERVYDAIDRWKIEKDQYRSPCLNLLGQCKYSSKQNI